MITAERDAQKVFLQQRRLPVVVRKVPSEARWGPNDFCVFCSFAFLFDFSFLFCNKLVVVRKFTLEARREPKAYFV